MAVIDPVCSSDTLNELAASLNDDANFAGTMTTALAGKLGLAGGTMTGDIAMGGNSITGLAAPSAGNDAANKTYVDGEVTTTNNNNALTTDDVAELSAPIILYCSPQKQRQIALRQLTLVI